MFFLLHKRNIFWGKYVDGAQHDASYNLENSLKRKGKTLNQYRVKAMTINELYAYLFMYTRLRSVIEEMCVHFIFDVTSS